MNKKLKNFFTPRNIFILLIIIVGIYIVTSLFNITKKDEPTIINTENMKFSKFETFDDYVLHLFKNDNSFSIKDSEGTTVYETEEHITDFIFLDKEHILISVLSENTVNSDLLYSVKKINLTTLESEEIYNLNGEMYMFSKDSNVVIVNTQLKKAFEFGSKTVTHDLPKDFYKVFYSNNEIFAVYYYIEDDNIYSYVYQYTENGFEEVFLFRGKISFISTDYNNPNKIYITFTSKANPIVPEVCEKYLINLSTSNSGEKIYTHLTGRIFSGANGTYLLNTETYMLNLLNSDLSIKSDAASLHRELPLSMVKIDKKSGTLYCVDSNYKIRKDLIENEK